MVRRGSRVQEGGNGMSTTHAARRENPLARLSRLARPRREVPALHPAPVAEVHHEPRSLAAPETLAAIVAQAEAESRAASAPLAETEPWGAWDRPDGLLMDERDEYVPPQRPYVPEPAPYTPDLCADLADLPAFREALGMRTRCHAGECLCGHPLPGDQWGERMVRAGIHLLTSKETAA